MQKLHKNIKNEINNTHGPFLVIDITDEREPSNGCVKWLCKCKNCGTLTVRNGNLLRFSKHNVCDVCGKREVTHVNE